MATASPACSDARVATLAEASTSLRASSIARIRPAAVEAASRIAIADCSDAAATSLVLAIMPWAATLADSKSDVEGKSLSVRVDFGGRRILKKKNKQHV